MQTTPRISESNVRKIKLNGMRLKSRGEVPNGGFVFKLTNGEVVTGIPCFESSVIFARKHLIENNISIDIPLADYVDSQNADYFWSIGKSQYVNSKLPSIFSQYDKIHRIDDSKLLRSPHNYNPGLIKKGDEIWMVYRQHVDTGESYAVAVKLDENLQPIAHTNKVIDLPVYHENQTNEDPRVFWFNGNIHISWTSWHRGDWSYIPIMRLAKLDDSWNVVQDYDLEFGGNGKSTEKNWCFFEHEKELHMIYKANPHQIVKFKNYAHGDIVANTSGIKWQHGEIRGGTPPIRIGDEYLTFFHSRIGYLKNCTYYMGAYFFEAKYPFRILRYTPAPLLGGSNDDDMWNNKVKVVFPDGCVLDENNLIVSVGVNDKFSAIYQIEVDSLEEKMKKI